jgi:2-hydroxychromene-2-carboxylate isomerase
VDADAAFYFDLTCPAAYLVAEQVLQVMPVACEWIPVSFGAGSLDREALEARAGELGLQRFVWPDPFPFDSRTAMLTATYAKRIGRTVAFAQAAFRQAFAGGHALEQTDWVLVAASACEMHPKAILTAIATRGVREELDRASAQARERGVLDVPTVRVGNELFAGEAALRRAVAAAAA